MHDNRIPVIDIAPFFSGNKSSKHIVGRQVDAALRTIGFMTIVGHGVPGALIQRARSTALEFFNGSLAEKMQIARTPEQPSRGYSWVGNRSLAYSLGQQAPPDLQEGFAMGPIDMGHDADDSDPDVARFFAPNLWPERPAALREVLEAYYRDMARLATTLMRIFAVGLDLPEAYFADKIDQHTSVLRAIHYPPQVETPEPDQLRAGAHTDYGTLTILYGDDTPGGLQVRHRHGDWMDVHPTPGALVCNIGDLMARWTNDRWVSNLHRVVNPPRDYADMDRLSIPFFHNPNHNAEIRCIASCLGPHGIAKYPPVRFSDHYLGKLTKAEHMRLDVEN